MINLVERIDFEIERRSLLRHPFYQMWSEGKLTHDHLRTYSKEYFQLVKAVPRFVENISHSVTTDPFTKMLIDQNFKEESEHIEPWIRFANAIGVSRNELLDCIGTDKTNASISDLTHLTSQSLEVAAAAMYAYEMELPKISRSKIDGLNNFYGVKSHHATKYFEIHEEVDLRHSELWKNILQTIPEEKQKFALSAAINSLEAQNKLLDSVQKNYVEC